MPLHNKAVVDTYQGFKHFWILWKCLGLQPPKHGTKLFKCYISYAIILHSTVLLLPVALFVNLFLSENISELCENICNLATSLVCILKFLNAFFIRHKLLKMSQLLRHLDARAELDKEVAILEQSITSAKQLFIFLAVTSVCFIMACQLIVTFSTERVLAVSVWYPWDWTASRKNHLIAHYYQIYSMSILAMMDAVCNTYLPTCLVILAGHTQTLSLRIMAIGTKTVDSQDTLYAKLTDCIKDHIAVHHLFYIFQDITSIASMAQFAATCLSQCTLGIYMIYEGNDIFVLLYIFVYFSGITMEVFLLCYYGDLYCQANDHLTESIYASNWMDRNVKYKKAILLLLQRSQRPSAIKAGNLIPLQMPTFVKILKTAYSAFTFLNNSN